MITSEQKKNVEEWIKSLRSGKYYQAQGRLRITGPAYCCLGVACDLYDTNKWEREPENSLLFQYLGNGTGTEKEVREHYGFSLSMMDYLITLNDDRRFTFSQIADYIESVYLTHSWDACYSMGIEKAKGDKCEL